MDCGMVISQEKKDEALLVLAELGCAIRDRPEWRQIAMVMDCANQVFFFLEQFWTIATKSDLSLGVSYQDIEALDLSVEHAQRVLDLIGRIETRGCDPERMERLQKWPSFLCLTHLSGALDLVNQTIPEEIA